MLDKIRKNRILSSISICLITFVAAAIIWPLLDFLWAKIISRSTFSYNPKDYILEPAIFAVIFGLITFFVWKSETKLEKQAKKESKKK